MAAVPHLLEGIPKVHLNLHVDINRTIIQTDPAGGKSLEDILNNNLSSICLGYLQPCSEVKKEQLKTEWEWVAVKDPEESIAWQQHHHRNGQSSGNTGQAEGSEKQEAAPLELVSYDHYVDNIVFPKPAAEMKLQSSSERRATWNKVTEKRRSLKNVFTHTGQPGEKFRKHYEKLLKAMIRPVPSGPNPSDKYWSIIPSFFVLVNTLSVLEWPFTLTFRTFGHDLPRVLAEFEAFCLGEIADVLPEGPLICQSLQPRLRQWMDSRREHYRSALNGSTAEPKPHGDFSKCLGCSNAGPHVFCTPIASVFRSAQGMYLTANVLAAPNVGTQRTVKQYYSDPTLYGKDVLCTSTSSSSSGVVPKITPHKIHYSELYPPREVLKRLAQKQPDHHQPTPDNNNKKENEAVQPLTDATSKMHVLGLIDYYPWWSEHGEHFSAGKVYPISLGQARLTPPSMNNSTREISAEVGVGVGEASIFFDDNIFIDDPDGHSIVDIRDVISSAHSSISKTKNSEHQDGKSTDTQQKKQEEEDDVRDGVALSGEHIVGKYLCQVQPYLAILNPTYFVEELSVRLRAQTQGAGSSGGQQQQPKL